MKQRPGARNVEAAAYDPRLRHGVSAGRRSHLEEHLSESSTSLRLSVGLMCFLAKLAPAGKENLSLPESCPQQGVFLDAVLEDGSLARAPVEFLLAVAKRS